MFNEPPCPAGWSLLRRDPVAGVEKELRLWDDPAGGLTVSRLGAEAAGRYRLCFNDELRFEVETRDKLIIEWSEENAVLKSTTTHALADQVYPRIIAHDGNLVLHAGAFAVKNGCILVVGASGRGKSSLVTSFDKAGFPLLGDDALVISRADGVHLAKAVYPSLRLFPDSINALLEDNVGTSEVAHYTTKQRIDIPVSADSATEPMPILAMFMLLDPLADANIRIERLSVAESCMSLVENSFALDPSDGSRAAKRLELASALARQVQAFAISYPRDYGRLPAVREAILHQCVNLR